MIEEGVSLLGWATVKESSEQLSKPSTRATKPSSVLAYIVWGCFVAFVITYLTHFWYSWPNTSDWYLLLIVKSILEFIFAFHAISLLTISVAYLFSDWNKPKDRKKLLTSPPVGIIYLCCGDISQRALRSLVSLEYAGRLCLIIHDDSIGTEAQAQVNAIVAEIRLKFSGEVLLLRRTEKEWGKPGAVNYVIKNTSHLYDYFILCDNDSTVVTRDAIPKALAYFSSPEVAIVQFRNTAIVDEQDSLVNSILSEAIDVFRVYVATASKWGWLPFLGHNAMLSTTAFLEIGGMKPFFADDIDLSIRLNMCGYKIIYADEIVFGEEHPHSYTAFRARNYKWAYGCIQVLREHGWNILLSRNLSSCEKWCLLSLISFYLVQSSFIIYMVISYILLPFFAKGLSPEIWQIFLTDILLITAIFSYTWAYFLKKRRLFDWFRFAIICAIVYGGTGLLSIKGTWDSLRGKRRDWIPTNTTHSSTAIHLKVLAEPLLAGLVFCIPYLSSRVLPISPLLYLFVSIYSIVPLITYLYRWRAPKLWSAGRSPTPPPLPNHA